MTGDTLLSCIRTGPWSLRLLRQPVPSHLGFCDCIPSDCRGCVHCLKLSPNLRRQSKVVGAQAADSSVLQLDAILAVALKSMDADA